MTKGRICAVSLIMTNDATHSAMSKTRTVRKIALGRSQLKYKSTIRLLISELKGLPGLNSRPKALKSIQSEHCESPLNPQIFLRIL